MTDKTRRLLYESFEDRKMAILVGFLCLIYYAMSYLSESMWLAKILPPWPFLPYLTLVIVLTFIIQLVVWKLFRHFEVKWYKYAAGWVLFICEFGLILFSVTFCTWPFYLFYQYLITPRAPY